MKIGLAIKLARKNLHLTVNALADQVGLPPSTIKQIESGEGNLSLQTIQGIAKALGFRISQLVTIAESILEPKNEIKRLQRRLLLAVQPILVRG